MTDLKRLIEIFEEAIDILKKFDIMGEKEQGEGGFGGMRISDSPVYTDHLAFLTTRSAGPNYSQASGFQTNKEKEKQKKILKKEKEKEKNGNCSYFDQNSGKISCGDGCKFDFFWEVYPVKTNKFKAHRAFVKTVRGEPQLADQIIFDVKKRLELDSKWQDVRFIPHATTYLNGRRWEDLLINREQKNDSGTSKNLYSRSSKLQQVLQWTEQKFIDSE